ncbi:MAG: hypothetical protein AAB354_01930, partial [candidate division KSB1 bacterium]
CRPQNHQPDKQHCNNTESSRHFFEAKHEAPPVYKKGHRHCRSVCSIVQRVVIQLLLVYMHPRRENGNVSPHKITRQSEA